MFILKTYIGFAHYGDDLRFKIDRMLFGSLITEYEMGKLCRTNVGRLEGRIEVLSKNVKGRDHLEDLTVDGSVTLNIKD